MDQKEKRGYPKPKLEDLVSLAIPSLRSASVPASRQKSQGPWKFIEAPFVRVDGQSILGYRVCVNP